MYASADSAVCSFFFFGKYYSLEIISRFFFGTYFPDQGFQGSKFLSSVIKTMFSQSNPNLF
jgi:hypothetical protein